MQLQTIKLALTAYFEERFSSTVAITNISRLSGGASLDNYALDLLVKQGEWQGNYELVLRTDKGVSLGGSLLRLQEFEVMKVAFAAGVKTPQPLWAETDTNVIGQPFYLMTRAVGVANPRFVVKAATKTKEAIAHQLAQMSSSIHSIHPHKDIELDFLPLSQDPYYPARNAIAQIRKLVYGLPQDYPAIELCLNWLESNMPSCDGLVLVHGDFRTGNFLIDKQQLTALLDWEFAHWGDRHEDLAWLSLRDWRFGKLRLPIGGLVKRSFFYDAYEEASGVSIDMSKIFYWEVLGNIRWAVGAHLQAERHLSSKDKGIEFAAIGRRACEMEYEAMTLIKKGLT